MEKRYVIECDLYDFHDKKVGHKTMSDIYAVNSFQAINKARKEYGRKEYWGHVKAKNFKVKSFEQLERKVEVNPYYEVHYIATYPTGRINSLGWPEIINVTVKTRMRAKNASEVRPLIRDYWQHTNKEAKVSNFRIFKEKG